MSPDNETQILVLSSAVYKKTSYTLSPAQLLFVMFLSITALPKDGVARQLIRRSFFPGLAQLCGEEKGFGV